MFIIERPFASDLCFKTLERLQAPVLRTDAISEFNVNNRLLNLFSDAEFAEYYRRAPTSPLYCNSENALRWIAENLPDAPIADAIRLFKDKGRFRRALASVYPDFYFREVDAAEIGKLPYRELPRRFVVKPSVGFLSVGVRFVESEADWERVRREIAAEQAALGTAAPQFSPDVVDFSRYLIEEALDGEEIAVDAYFDRAGAPIVLDVLLHPFVDADDVRDRVYATSPALVARLLPTVETMLKRIGNAVSLPPNAPFPLHLELRVDAAGRAVPIEVNPCRFAGWHTTEIARFAYGVDVYESFERQSRPDWTRIFAQYPNLAAAPTTYFAIFETPPQNADSRPVVGFDLDALKRRFERLFELRPIDFRRFPISAIAFAQTTRPDVEIPRILALDVAEFALR